MREDDDASEREGQSERGRERAVSSACISMGPVRATRADVVEHSRVMSPFFVGTEYHVFCADLRKSSAGGAQLETTSRPCRE